MKRKNKISIINALLEWIFRSENFFAHFHFQLWNRFSLSSPFINRKILLKLKISYFTGQNAIIFLLANTISYHFANFPFFFVFFVCSFLEADYTLDDSFWNDESPVGEYELTFCAKVLKIFKQNFNSTDSNSGSIRLYVFNDFRNNECSLSDKVLGYDFQIEMFSFELGISKATIKSDRVSYGWAFIFIVGTLMTFNYSM